MPFAPQPSLWKFVRTAECNADTPTPDPYRAICDQLYSLLISKSGYYGNPHDGPLSNALGVAEDGIEPWRYQVARIGEKCRRLRGDAQHDREKLLATIRDIAGHAVVALACLEMEGP